MILCAAQNLIMIVFCLLHSFAYLVKGMIYVRLIALHFKILSITRHNHEYYRIVEKPIDFIRIQQKIRTDSYQNFEQFISDIELLLKNAKTFYLVCSLSNTLAKKQKEISNYSKQQTNGVMLISYRNILNKLNKSG